MLLLKRRIEEAIVIGDDIRVKILKIHDGNVTLGITAPESVEVDRLEVRENKDRTGIRRRARKP